MSNNLFDLLAAGGDEEELVGVPRKKGPQQKPLKNTNKARRGRSSTQERQTENQRASSNMSASATDQRTREGAVEIRPSFDRPEIIYPETIPLRDSNKCASACKELLAAVPKDLDRKYRLELYPADPKRIDDKWCLRIKLDAVEWFDRVLSKEYENDLPTIAAIARGFVDKTYDDIHNLPAVDPPERAPSEPKPYCTDRECLMKRPPQASCEKGTHPKLCMYKIPRSDGANRVCRFFFQEDFLIWPNGPLSGKLTKVLTSQYKLINRREAIRDLLLVPPLAEGKNTRHQTNSNLVQTPEVWKMVFDIYKILQEGDNGRLMLEGVAANFGKWETANSMDASEYALDCHGHLHLLLSRVAIDRLAREEGCRGLVGRVYHANTHLEEDCRELETRRLLSLENKITHGQLAEFKTQLQEVDTKVSEFKTQLQEVDTKVSDMASRFDRRFNEFDQRFNEFDQRFNEFDQRFNEFDQRFNQILAHLTNSGNQRSQGSSE